MVRFLSKCHFCCAYMSVFRLSICKTFFLIFFFIFYLHNFSFPKCLRNFICFNFVSTYLFFVFETYLFYQNYVLIWIYKTLKLILKFSFCRPTLHKFTVVFMSLCLSIPLLHFYTKFLSNPFISHIFGKLSTGSFSSVFYHYFTFLLK